MSSTKNSSQATSAAPKFQYTKMHPACSKAVQDSYVRHTQYMLHGQILASVKDNWVGGNKQNKIAKSKKNDDTAKACHRIYTSALRTPARNPMGAKMMLLSERAGSYIALNKRNEAMHRQNSLAAQLRSLEMPERLDSRVMTRFFAFIIILLAAALMTCLLVI